MLLGLQVVSGWMAFVSLFGLALLGWGLYRHQFDDIEETKFIPFREREPEAWPGRKSNSKGV